MGAAQAAGTVPIGRRRARPGELAFPALLLLVLLLALAVLVTLVGTVLAEAVQVFRERGTDFLRVGLSSLPSRAGVAQGIAGSLGLMAIVVVVAFPLGIAAAVYLEEYASDTGFHRFVTANIRNLAGVPSIVYGLLGLAIFVQALGELTGGRSLLAGGLTMSILVLPIVVITASEAIRAVPSSIREAAFAVGATRWEVVRSHVLPSAAPGILTGVILTFARALGEAAPLILVGGAPGFFAAAGGGISAVLRGPYTALPAVIFNWSRRSLREFGPLTSAAIVVLLGVLLLVNGIAVFLRHRYERRW